MGVQPMPSTKVAEGEYVVLGTSTACVVKRAYSRASAPLTRWSLFSDDKLVRHFDTKREALVYCQEHPEL